MLLRGEAAQDFSPHYRSLVAAIGGHDVLKGKKVIVFYSNEHGKRFTNFPRGADPKLSHVRFVDLDNGREDYFPIDGHLTAQGNRYVAARLVENLDDR